MNTEVMFSSKTEMWETPQDFFDKLNEEFHFTLDVCAIPENTKCENFYTPEIDDSRSLGRVQFGAIRRMAGRSEVGSDVRYLLPSLAIQWLCFFPLELIQDGSMNTFMAEKM